MPRWFTEHPAEHSAAYAARFRRLSAEGADLDGEARMIDTLVARGSRILDAGCGGGRTGAALHRRGHYVIGVDIDAELVDAARADYAGPSWVVADLAGVTLAGLGSVDQPFDAVVLAGNVLVFLAPGTEGDVLQRLASVVRPDGVVVTGFATGRHYALSAFDADCAAAGLLLEHRFATWDLRPWHEDASWAVSVLRAGPQAGSFARHSSPARNP